MPLFTAPDHITTADGARNRAFAHHAQRGGQSRGPHQGAHPGCGAHQPQPSVSLPHLDGEPDQQSQTGGIDLRHAAHLERQHAPGRGLERNRLVLERPRSRQDALERFVEDVVSFVYERP